MAVATELLDDDSGDGSVLYLGFGDGDPLDEELQLLSLVNPRISLRPFSERTGVDDRCDSGEIVIGSCRKDDFLHVEFQDMLVWRTALVRYRTAGCHGSYLVVNVLGHWRPIAEPWSFGCI